MTNDSAAVPLDPRNPLDGVKLPPWHLAAVIADRIRRELVCCTQFGDIQDRGTSYEAKTELFKELVNSPRYHDLCYWGEGAARLAEYEGRLRLELRRRLDETLKMVVLKAITDALNHDEEYVRLADRERAASAAISTIEDFYSHEEAFQAMVELTEEANLYDEGTSTEACEVFYGANPSYRCYVARHEDCRRDGVPADELEVTCTCQCHTGSVLDETGADCD